MLFRSDPKTETFKEYPLPGPEPSPYAIGIDRNNMIWYSSHEQDTLGQGTDFRLTRFSP